MPAKSIRSHGVRTRHRARWRARVGFHRQRGLSVIGSSLRREPGTGLHRFDGDLTDFLVSFLTDRERVPMSPDDVPSVRPGFVRA
jgi:hypothetical protein